MEYHAGREPTASHQALPPRSPALPATTSVSPAANQARDDPGAGVINAGGRVIDPLLAAWMRRTYPSV